MIPEFSGSLFLGGSAGAVDAGEAMGSAILGAFEGEYFLPVVVGFDADVLVAFEVFVLVVVFA